MAKKRKNYYQNAIVNPIHQTATYYFESTDQVIEYHESESKTVGRYGRYDNPSWLEVEEKLAALDNAEKALIFPSGMSAISSTLLALIDEGDKLVFTGKGYRNIRTFCFDILGKYGAKVATLPLLSNAGIYDTLADQCTDDLKAVFIESPSNPHMFLVDIERVRDIVGPDCLIIVDGTFSTPFNSQPMAHGADLVIHSCAKYLGGHADILAGSVAGSSELIDKIRGTRNVMGAIVDPNTAFLLNRSLSTFPMRMRHINAAGQTFADYLQNDPRIGRVFYTGLAGHPHFDLAEKYLSGHGGVVTFEILGDEAFVADVVDDLKIPYMGTNFGSAQSMIEQLGLFTYYKQSAEERADLGITDTMVRYSIGFDDETDDIIADLDQALNSRLQKQVSDPLAHAQLNGNHLPQPETA